MLLWYGLGALPVVLGFLPFLPTVVRIVSAALGYALFGFSVWREMLTSMRKRRIFTEFTLMCVASLGAFAIGEYADGAAVVYLYSLGETLSGRAYTRSKQSIAELLEILPEYATVLREETPIRVSPDEVAVGERILVSAGERIPLDGVVADGGGSADTSSVTGESKPLELYAGVACPSGSILHEGSVVLRVTERYENSVVAKLARAVKDASERKSRAEKRMARFARVFTPIAFGAAALICLLGTLITKDFGAWLRIGLLALVVSCPCSLVLSVPLTYFAGLGRAAASGIVFRGGEVMDAACRLRAVAFDKTGTITESGLRFDGAQVCGAATEEEFLSLAYDVLSRSPHAAALSFCQAYTGELDARICDVELIGGRGIVCSADGRRVCFGNAALMRENGIPLEDSPTTVIFGAVNGTLWGKLCFSSHVRESSRRAIAQLRRGGMERICLLSGDGRQAVARTCEEVGIEEYYAALTPSEKVECFERLQREVRQRNPKSTVAFCGDGLNDSAVIAGADVGIAMGKSGSALTVRTADVVLMDDDPAKVWEAIRIARRTSRIAGQNVALSLGIKLAVVLLSVCLSVTLQAEIPMGLAIVADVGAALLAVLNALRAGRRSTR